MWNKNLVRLLGALIAVVLTAASCGSSASTTTAANSTEASSEATEDSAAEDSAAEEADGHDHDEGHSHGDDGLEVDASLPIPAVAIDVTETAAPGTFTLAVELENFTITEENIDGDPIDNEGHMHFLIDGERVDRFTDLEIEIQVPEGEHLVEVELNSNNHQAYTVGGEPIRAGVTVTGSGEAPEADPAPQASDADVVLTAAFVGGSVELDGPDRLEVTQGDVVMVMISSDTTDEIHVHGYDIFADVAPDADAMIVFNADTPGRFEVEFEQSGQFIAELVVS